MGAHNFQEKLRQYVQQFGALDLDDVSLGDSEDLNFGAADDVAFEWDGTNLNVLPLTDDTGAILVGNGTVDMDFKVFLGSTSEYVECDVGNSKFKAVADIDLAPLGGYNAQEGISDRYRLEWTAGAQGKPGVNGDIQSATEATREIADTQFEIGGTNCVSTCSAAYAEGGILLTTTTGSADQVIVTPHLDASQSAWTGTTWGSDKSVRWDALIETTAAITDETIWAGLKLTDTSVTATDADQVMFRYAPGTNSGKWEAINSIGNTDVETDSGVTVAINTKYHLAIIVSSARIATLYINGALVGTSAALTDTTDFIPYIGIQTDTTAAKSLRVYKQAISRVAG